VNLDLTDECLVSFAQLEEAFIKDETSNGFNLFGSGDDMTVEQIVHGPPEYRKWENRNTLERKSLLDK
jgi:hypothetical protein